MSRRSNDANKVSDQTSDFFGPNFSIDLTDGLRVLTVSGIERPVTFRVEKFIDLTYA